MTALPGHFLAYNAGKQRAQIKIGIKRRRNDMWLEIPPFIDVPVLFSGSQKTDQALQEVERQGYLSWRNDVPYVKGARVFFHDSTFHALKDNQDVEPQGSRDNGIWYLLPVQVYPTRYDSVEGLGTTAKHNAEDFDAIGSAKAVQEALEALKKALAKTATTGNMADALGTLAIEHGGTGATNAANARKNLGLQDGATMTKSLANWDTLAGNNNEALTTAQFVGLLGALHGSAENGAIRIPYFNGSTREYLVIQYGFTYIKYISWRRYNSQFTLPRAFTKSFDTILVSGNDTLNAYWTFSGIIKSAGSFEYTMYCVAPDGIMPSTGGNGFNWLAIGRD